jgi:sodium ion-translocating decarboxylase beta subunit
MIESITSFLQLTGFSLISWQMMVMWAVVLVLFYFAIYKKFEPLLLVPIAFGALVANLPTRGIISFQQQADGSIQSGAIHMEATVETVEGGAGVRKYHIHKIEGGLFDLITQGVKLELFPPLIFLGVGALTDFGPLIANPRTLLLGAAAQLGVFFTFLGASFLGFSTLQSASIGIIGGADGPTAIFTSNKLAPELLGPIAVAAYSYMALVPLIQPPIMKLLTTANERKIRMKSLRKVSRLEKIAFSIVVTIVCVMLVPDASPLIVMLMLGNFIRECGVTDRLLKAAQNEIINIVTIFLGVSVGITMRGEQFLQWETIKIIVLGVIAFSISTAGGVLMAKVMNLFSRANPINPLIGSAGVSAVPMAARVSHVEGQKYDPGNYLLMHAMGPNVAGVIGSAVVAGYFISTLAN